jgi:putative spermidine/putrescine transport system permease protein
MVEAMNRLVDDVLWVGVLMLGVLVVLFLVVPLCVTGLMAFDSRTYLGPLPPPSFSTQWFARFFSQQYFIEGLKTSLKVSGLAVLIAVSIGVAAAVYLHERHTRRATLLASFFVAPLIVPPVVLGFALLVFLATIGIFDGFVRLVCGHVILITPYAIRATLASLAGLDPHLPEAAMSLGATERQAFWRVTFPLSRTGIIAGAIFGLAVSLDDVAVSMFLTDPETYTLPVALISNMRASFDLTIAAASLLIVGANIALMLALDRCVGINRILGQGLRGG